jgi:hypothetical protein
MQLMHKNAARHKRFRLLGNLSKFLFVISLIVAIVCALLVVLAAIWPMLFIILVIMTLGTILLGGSVTIDSGAAFIKDVIPIASGALIAAGVLFVISFVLEYLDYIAEVRELKKNPQENEHYLKIAGVVLKIKILKLIRIVAVIAIIGIMVGVAQAVGFDSTAAGMVVLKILAAVVIVASPVVNHFYAKAQFKKIEPSVEAVLKEKETAKNIK